MELSEHARRNRAVWTVFAEKYREPGRRAWANPDPDWGIWAVKESELRILNDVAGKDVIELGCGTAYWSAWLRVWVAGRSGSTSRPPSSPAPGRSRTSSISTFRSSRRAPRACRCRTRASTSPSPSTGRASGPTPIAGCRRPPASSAGEVL